MGNPSYQAFAAVTLSSVNAESSAPLVLIVDDYEDSRYIYVHALTAAGYRVEEAEDGQQGLDKAFHETPDVVVMDLSLPILDGWEAIRRLRKDERTRHIPIVALTGHADVEGDDNPGFDALLVKPCSPDALTDQVKTLLAGTAKGQASP